MEKENPIILLREDFNLFRQWVDLREEVITWEGRYEKEFNEFWGLFFRSGITLAQLKETFRFAETYIKSGPLVSWFHWLRAKMVCFVFIKKGLSIAETSEQFEMEEAQVALILRDFFVERYPHLEERISYVLHICDPLSDNVVYDYERFSKEFGIVSDTKGALNSDVMNSLEVTLYPEWRNLLQALKKSFLRKGQRANQLSRSSLIKRQFDFVKEIALVLIIGALFIVGVKYGNQWYEDYLINKISLFEPNFFKPYENVTFKRERPNVDKEIKLSAKELEELEKVETKNIFQDSFEQRFEPESEVILTSVDSLPRDFSSADYEQSLYEEERKGGYRDSLYGNSKTYRVLLNSVDPPALKKRVNQLLDYYKVSQVDNVRPGTKIPGGVYYNLYVPYKHLKEFLTQVTDLEQASLYVSQSRVRVPAGKKRVFIWIKSI